MILNRNRKYRIYPTAKQEQILRGWEATLRFLWNLCHEQRLRGLARSKEERVYVSQSDQQKQMTELLVEYPWIAEVECHARQKTLEDLAYAWQRCFSKLSGQPRWKHKNEGIRIYLHVSIAKPVLQTVRKNATIYFRSKRFQVLGTLELIYHRELDGIVKSWSIFREGTEWYAMANVEITKPDPVPVNDKVVGIDRGVINQLADSDGRLVPRPTSTRRCNR